MKRREFLAGSVGLAMAGLSGRVAAAVRAPGEGKTAGSPGGGKLTPPESGSIPVAVTVSEGVTVIDFAGPWEVFQDVTLGGDEPPFRLYTVSEGTRPVTGSAGLRIVPDYSFEQAPQPRVIVVPAQRGSKALHAWLRKASEKADLTMSVCTGAFQLARAGLLKGMAATTHHEFWDSFSQEFPDIELRRGLRFVDNGRIATAGGLTSGIDMALHVISRYYGKERAAQTAKYLEYQSPMWGSQGA